ncbi:hypothetical protein QQ045_008825 [Rhodiola kirilowii]
MLTCLNFPLKFISWIGMCVESTSFSVQIMVRWLILSQSPLLFTIAMEYLSRSLKGLTRANDFYHYPKCHRIDLKHIIFADDLFLFNNGRSSSILALKTALDDFLQCFGLSVNIDKSQVFVPGMTEDKRSWTENLLRTRISILPVRYLGFPLTSRSISAHDCSIIIQRIIKKLGFWSNKFLSRAGKRVLIQSVLQAIVFYWARICILPKTVLKTINAICARFLWNGYSTGRGSHLLSWDTSCLDKREGGLGFRDLEVMNNAMILNQLWDLNRQNQNLWNLWTRAYWTKGVHLWENNKLVNSSWVLHRLAMCKHLSSKCVDSVSDDLQWIGEEKGFIVKDTYHTLKAREAEVDWYKLAWNRFNQPRASFNAVLIAQDRLPTKARLRIRGISVPSSCVLCNEEEETRNHLFFCCRISQAICGEVLKFLKVSGVPTLWHLLIPWFKDRNQKHLRTRMIAAV